MAGRVGYRGKRGFRDHAGTVPVSSLKHKNRFQVPNGGVSLLRESSCNVSGFYTLLRLD